MWGERELQVLVCLCCSGRRVHGTGRLHKAASRGCRDRPLWFPWLSAWSADLHVTGPTAGWWQWTGITKVLPRPPRAWECENKNRVTGGSSGGTENPQAQTQSCIRDTGIPSPELSLLLLWQWQATHCVPTTNTNTMKSNRPGRTQTLTCSFEQLSLDEGNSCCSDTPSPGQCPPWTSPVSARECAGERSKKKDYYYYYFIYFFFYKEICKLSLSGGKQHFYLWNVWPWDTETNFISVSLIAQIRF